MAQLVAIRYAAALFEIAKEKDMVDKFDEQCKMINTLIGSDKDFKNVLSHPSITDKEKMEVLERSLKGIISDDILGLINLLFRKNREDVLSEVLSEFSNLVLKYKKIVIAQVYSAIPLSKERIEKIKSELQNKLQKQVEIHTVVDKTLLGGIRILIDGFVIDRSVRTSLSNLRNQLLENKIAKE